MISHSLHEFQIVAVVPAYNEGRKIGAVLSSIPAYVRQIVVVDDCSRDDTPAAIERCAEQDARIELIRHPQNQGVGGAMRTGFRRALELGAQLVVKIDGDGQMSPDDLPQLLEPLIRGEADYTKGNRFRDFQALRKMPPLRQVGNMGLTFLTKAAVGYWNITDPCNGYTAIRGEVLAQLPLERVHSSFFFETSMLAELYLLGAVVKDVPLPARYGDETSHLSVFRVSLEFPGRLATCFARRLVLKNFLFDFSMETIYLLVGLPLLLSGTTYGGINWIRYALLGMPAPTGTVVISALLIILGFQLLLSAVNEDLRAVPREPLAREPLAPSAGNAAGPG